MRLLATIILASAFALWAFIALAVLGVTATTAVAASAPRIPPGGPRGGIAARFAGIPDVHYGDDDHWVSGERGVSEWTLTGTTPDGQKIEVRGCDLWTFRNGKVVRKDSYWKIVE